LGFPQQILIEGFPPNSLADRGGDFKVINEEAIKDMYVL
jgi:hypothetical protein